MKHPFSNIDVTSYVSPGEHKIRNGLHKICVTQTEIPFIVEGNTEYKILIGTGKLQEEGALFLQKHLFLATGAKLEIVRDCSNCDVSLGKWIVIDLPSYFAAAGLSMPNENIGETGYFIKTVNEAVFIAVSSPLGIQRAVLAFLHQVIGYDFISSDTIIYEKNGSILPQMEIIEVSDFEFYLRYNCFSQEDLYAMGYNKWEVFVPVDGNTWHNTLKYLPKDEYFTSHPKWFATNASGMKGYDGKVITDVCCTAHGDADEYDKMIRTYADGVIHWADKYPNFPAITISLMDHHFSCECPACEAESKRYGGCKSASLIKLVNNVNRLVQAHYEEQAKRTGEKKRKLDLLIFAYRAMEKPPVVKVDEKWVPMDNDIRLDDNVGVFLAAINAKYARSFYHPDNVAVRNIIEGWSALSNEKLYMWTYGCNFHLYNYPLNNYETMTETLRFCKANGARFMFMQGNGTSKGATHFTALRSYIAARTCFNVNCDVHDLEDRFFKYYFGVAQNPMRQFYEELKRYLLYLETVRPDMILGGIYDEYELDGLWDQEILQDWLGLIEEAYQLIQGEENLEQREKLCLHILRESLFPRYALLRRFPDRFSPDELKRMRLSFKEDCATVSLTAHWEGKNIQAIFDEWGI